MAATLTFIGTVVNNGVPIAGTFKIASTTTTTAVSCPISPTGGVKVAISCNFGDTLTFTADQSGTVTSTTKVLATQPFASYPYQILWDTAPNVIAGL